ncbi:MAG: hypothetical protein ABSG31_07685 [Tepidisphaeraceae bacterium]|jgi:hypothetical protein
MTTLDGWDNFYVMVGSSAGALIGLQFVVMTLIAELPTADPQAGNAFGTPNVVHFGVVLLLSAIVLAPWDGVSIAADLWGLLGFGGLIYCGIVIRRMRSQKAYHPVLEDWAFHCLMPLVAYAMLAASPWSVGSHPRAALFSVGAAALLLLYTGIHNAWDTVMYHVFFTRKKSRESERT